jgi:dTDP-4-dehydrorhamnose 3,5-epimerase
MRIQETRLPGVLILTPTIYRDSRGTFQETWNQRRMTEAGLPDKWVQDNFSVSSKNVLRGIHYQIVNPQGKLVRVTCGAVLDVAVDLRLDSPAFGKHVAVELTGDGGEMLWIPEGFGHAFLALTENVGFAYKVTNYYSPGNERTIVWNDRDLAIDWPLSPDSVVVSEKDQKGATLDRADVFALSDLARQESVTL